MENINVEIAGRTYPVKVKDGEKELLLGAVNLINEKVKLFEKQYPTTDKIDQLSMTLLQTVIEHLKGKAGHQEEMNWLAESLKESESFLSNYLNSRVL
jgi:cell division protein ZapA (FtsZ GTPase activity inhibitor)